MTDPAEVDRDVASIEARITAAGREAAHMPITAVVWEWYHERVNDLLDRRDELLARARGVKTT